MYDFIFVRPAKWLSEQFSYYFLDRKVIDGVLNILGYMVGVIGSFLRNYIDKPIINGAADFVGETTKKAGRVTRLIQTGKIQQYMIVGLASITAFVMLLYYLLVHAR
jgi:hypothetical protein